MPLPRWGSRARAPGRLRLVHSVLQQLNNTRGRPTAPLHANQPPRPYPRTTAIPSLPAINRRRRNGPLLPLLLLCAPPSLNSRAHGRIRGTPRRIPCPRKTGSAAAMAVDRVDGEEAFEEVDPTGRFGRYADVLGLGSVKKVYRGFDQEEGIEVAWNRVRLRSLADRDPGMVERLHAEVRLLRSLSHDHIIGFHKVWLDRDAGVLNFITEVCTSGSLREYRHRHRHVSVKALKKWARQILEGLNHLHTHDPCIIHRDLNCSNVFINGNNGQVTYIRYDRLLPGPHPIDPSPFLDTSFISSTLEIFVVLQPILFYSFNSIRTR